MVERKIHNFVSVILNDLTLTKEGFDPSVTGYQKRHIWAVCRFCGEPSRILGHNFKKSGSACHKECRLKEQSILSSPFKNKETREKAQNNRTKRLSSAEISRRISEGRKLAQSKIEKTCLEKFGCKNPFQSKEVKQKIRETNKKKYNHEHPMQNSLVAASALATQIKTIAARGEEIIEQRKKTCLNNFGVENPQQNTAIKTKTSQSFKEHVELNDDYYNLINTLRRDDFWDRMKEGKTLSDLCEIFNLNYGSLTYRLLDDEFVEKYYSLYSFPTQQKQREVAEFISSLGLKITENDRSIISPLEIDIYIPSLNIGIEFNGSVWHSEMKLGEKAKSKHKHKTNLCDQKNIRLIHIFEKHWEERKDQWKSYLRSALGKNTIKIPARKCELTTNLGGQVIGDNHLQGFTVSKITFDLKYNDQIVGSLALGQHHRTSDPNIIVLSRMAFANNTTVQGGASKMFAAALKWAREHGYKKIISWSDNTWTRGNIYLKLGFSLVDEYGPDYFYWDSKKDTYRSKQSQRKKATHCPENLTEHEWAAQRGLFRIWDCGKKRWEYSLS